MIRKRPGTRKLLPIVLATALVLNFFGCFEQFPLSPEAEKENPASEQLINIISLNKDLPALTHGSVTVTEWVTPEAGGRLLMQLGDVFATPDSLIDNIDNGTDSTYTDSTSDSANGIYGQMAGVKVELEVLPQSVESATELFLKFSDSNMDMEFGPHGLLFNNPALLNITANGLDLTNVNEETLGLYYYDPETAQWQQVESENVIVSQQSGIIQIVNARIPHFSRYAVAWSN
ncbi:MAG: hypothetical protein ACE5G1_00330 [bacterium]